MTDAKLKAARKKGIEKGHWSVVAALDSLLLDPTSLDARINVVGAMHEVGTLSNSLKPYWEAWRSSPPEIEHWVDCCFDRLRESDTDYWAIAALLGVPLSAISRSLQERKYKLLGVRFAESYKEGRWHIATFAGKHQGTIIAPVLEAGWSADETINEVSRWRAVILNTQTETSGSLIGHGSGSYFMRAKLPYGCWRTHDETFSLKAEWIVSKSQTALANYP